MSEVSRLQQALTRLGSSADAHVELADAIAAKMRAEEAQGITSSLTRVLEMPREALERLCQRVGSRLQTLAGLGAIEAITVQAFTSALADQFFAVNADTTKWLHHQLLVTVPAPRDAGAVTPETIARALVAIRDELRERDASEHYRLSKLPDHVIARYASRAVARADTSAGDPLERVASLLQSMITDGISVEPPPPAPNRMHVLSAPEVPAETVRRCPMGARVFQLAGLTRERGAAFVNDGLAEDGSISPRNMVGMDREQRAAHVARTRDLGNVVWTGACFELAQALAHIDPAAPGTRRRGDDPVRATYDSLPKSEFLWGAPNAQNASVLETSRAAATADPLARVADCVHSHGRAFRGVAEGCFEGNFYLRVPVGELGADLAFALVEAARLSLSAASQAALPLQNDSNAHELVAALSLVQEPLYVLSEGVASIATVIGLLLAKAPPPPYDDPDAALALLDRSQLVTRLAALAPFGVLGPMAATGLVPSEPIGVVRRHDGEARAQLPRSFEELLEVTRVAQAKKILDGDLEAWAKGDQRTVTARGCPVAGRGPIVDDAGKLELTKEAGLTVLTHAFVQLTRKILAERRKATPGAAAPT